MSDSVSMQQLRDKMHQSTIRICATMFACKRLPQGMPVTREDATALARETREFLSTLFTELESDGDQEKDRQEGLSEKARTSPRKQKQGDQAREKGGLTW